MAFAMGLPWHEGEEKMHSLMKSPRDHDNPTAPGLSMQAATMLQKAPLLAVGTLDAQNRPWTTLWGGSYGFARPLGAGLIGLRTPVDATYDPVVDALFKSAPPDGSGSGPEAQSKMVGGLTIDLETRKRVKLYGRMAAGGLAEPPDEDDATHKQVEAQLVVRIDQSLGNCPKYLNSKHITAAPTTPTLVSESALLHPDAQVLVSCSDLFFVSSSHSTEDMDTNHRGGPPGFVRLTTTPDGAQTQLVWPEYSGNRLYQTLGNLQSTPRAGLVFPDFLSGDVLYLTGTTDILVGPAAAALLPRSTLAVRLTVTAARLVRTGLPLRGAPGPASPYNPRVRPLAAEATPLASVAATASTATATLVARTQLAPDVYRLGFELAAPQRWRAGQWVALGLAGELDEGYSHMRDDDPTALNEDWVRTFTVSSAPPAGAKGGAAFEITIRAVGPVTRFLVRQNPRAGLEVSVVGFGGDFGVEQGQGGVVPFVAGGVGVTPLLAAVEGLDVERVVLLWSVRAVDLGLVVDVLQKYPGLSKNARLFVTAGMDKAGEEVDKIKALGVVVEARRMLEEDVKSIDVKRWYLCAGTALRTSVAGWLEGLGKEAVFEDFNF